MPPSPPRVLLVLLATLMLGALHMDEGCGFEDVPKKGRGEACSRTSECESPLVCAGGACMDDPSPDSGGLRFDGGPSPDSGTFDAAVADDAGDAAIDEDAAIVGDASPSMDGAPSDAATGPDDAEPDATGPDAAPF